MKTVLLSREAKTDKRGIFVFYGGWRYRPQGKTRAKQGGVIKLESPFNRYDEFAVVFVRGCKETWIQSTRLSDHKRGWQKIMRFSRHGFAYGLLTDYLSLRKAG